MATITILYFASIRTSLPSEPDSQLLHLPSTPTPFTLLSLRSFLINDVHQGNEEFERALGRSTWSVDEEMVEKEEEGSTVLKNGMTVCPIPPVSGG
ncbi:molybdopterin synthase/thiamine biosynthesis sulfur carrier, beta-grasp protein [Pseudohyphozyma bogoriensis]|nr:molybdopterin synthase/thiamine biosynthesis sulfur carrier, beta-grasp protein [Pseudohyphozyma bogoriensis]